MTIRVTAYSEGRIEGRLGSVQLNGETEFTSVIDLLLQMQEMMDQSNLPQRNEEVRSFAGEQGSFSTRPLATDKTQAIAVFQVNVMFRQNATWQGNLLWVDANQEAHFRSVLELLFLLHSALTMNSESGEAK